MIFIGNWWWCISFLENPASIKNTFCNTHITFHFYHFCTWQHKKTLYSTIPYNCVHGISMIQGKNHQSSRRVHWHGYCKQCKTLLVTPLWWGDQWRCQRILFKHARILFLQHPCSITPKMMQYQRPPLFSTPVVHPFQSLISYSHTFKVDRYHLSSGHNFVFVFFNAHFATASKN